MADPDTAAVSITIQSKDFKGEIAIEPYLDFDVHNKDTNYGDQFWTAFDSHAGDNFSFVTAATKKTNFVVSALMKPVLKKNGSDIFSSSSSVDQKRIGLHFSTSVAPGEALTLEKYVCLVSSLY